MCSNDIVITAKFDCYFVKEFGPIVTLRLSPAHRHNNVIIKMMSEAPFFAPYSLNSQARSLE